MAVSTDSPQIAALKIAAEKRLGHKAASRSDFTYLSSEIERTTHEHLAENTLRRIWGCMKGYDTVYVRTLDVLSRYVGAEHWDDFCETLKRDAHIESDMVRNDHSISADDLKPGDRIRIGWLPDRECIIEYEGAHTFKAIDCKCYRNLSPITLGITLTSS